MSVIVKGMEMPSVCIQGDWFGNCPMDRQWCAQSFAPIGYTAGQIRNDQQDKLPNWCPLVELPEKHGRLIDESQLRETFGMGERCNECKQDKLDCQYNQLFTRMDFCGWLDEMDIIVESEGE